MTVGTNMHKALADMQSLAATLKTFALETNDQQAKQQFDDYSRQLEQMSQGFKQRVNYVEGQEPTYKMQQQQQ